MPTAPLAESLPYFLLFLFLTLALIWPFYKRSPLEYYKGQDGAVWEYTVALKIWNVFHIWPARSVMTMMGGATSETDLAFATKAGIIAVECKYRNNNIEGTYDGRYWKCGSGTLYNPVMQNDTHIKSIRTYLSETVRMDNITIPGPGPMQVPVYNVVVIMSRGKVMFDFKKIRKNRLYHSDKSPDVYVLNREGAVRKLKSLPKVMSEEAAIWYNAQLTAFAATDQEMADHERMVKAEQMIYQSAKRKL